MRNIVDKIKYKFFNDRRAIYKGGFFGIVGFLLSPLSWWNDLLINLPVAYVFAYVVTFVVQPIAEFNTAGFIFWIAIGYWLSNLLGFWLLHLSAKELIDRHPHNIRDFVIALVYTVVIIILAWLGFSEPITEAVNLVPSWIVQ